MQSICEELFELNGRICHDTDSMNQAMIEKQLGEVEGQGKLTPPMNAAPDVIGFLPSSTSNGPGPPC
jgi:hypothetical protein